MSDEILPYSNLAQSVKIGIYKHFKGGEYEVLGVARHSEKPEEEYIVYKSLKTGYMWVRPIEMFFERVERGNYKGPRFQFIKYC